MVQTSDEAGIGLVFQGFSSIGAFVSPGLESIHDFTVKCMELLE